MTCLLSAMASHDTHKLTLPSLLAPFHHVDLVPQAFSSSRFVFPNFASLSGSHKAVEALLTAPGSLHELQTTLVDGQVQRVYKKLWPSLRIFWMWAANEHKDAVYAVFENQRPTFGQVFDRSLRAAAVFYDVYGIRKGARADLALLPAQLL